MRLRITHNCRGCTLACRRPTLWWPSGRWSENGEVQGRTLPRSCSGRGRARGAAKTSKTKDENRRNQMLIQKQFITHSVWVKWAGSGEELKWQVASSGDAGRNQFKLPKLAVGGWQKGRIHFTILFLLLLYLLSFWWRRQCDHGCLMMAHHPYEDDPCLIYK